MARNIRLVEFSDEEVYPIEKSAEGTNAYYCEYCPAAGYRPNYASCLRRISDYNSGKRLDQNEASCAAAIASGTACPSLGMRREETSAGRALYYLNRAKMRKNQEENAETMGIKLGQIDKVSINHAQDIPQGIPHKPEFKPEPTLAGAINKRMRELSKNTTGEKTAAATASTSTVNTVSSSKSKSPVTDLNTKGLSLLEIAKLRKQQTAN